MLSIMIISKFPSERTRFNTFNMVFSKSWDIGIHVFETHNTDPFGSQVGTFEHL